MSRSWKKLLFSPYISILNFVYSRNFEFVYMWFMILHFTLVYGVFVALFKPSHPIFLFMENLLVHVVGKSLYVPWFCIKSIPTKKSIFPNFAFHKVCVYICVYIFYYYYFQSNNSFFFNFGWSNLVDVTCFIIVF